VVRSHAFDLPKKVRALALSHALSSKAKDGSLIVVDNVSMQGPEDGRPARQSWARCGVSTRAWSSPALQVDKNFGLAARNIPNVDVLSERRPERLRTCCVAATLVPDQGRGRRDPRALPA
jgi:large subunit ribosomal protein L4